MSQDNSAVRPTNGLYLFTWIGVFKELLSLR